MSPDGKTLLVNGSAANVVASFAISESGTLTDRESPTNRLRGGRVKAVGSNDERKT